jgi:hypothetical protein
MAYYYSDYVVVKKATLRLLALLPLSGRKEKLQKRRNSGSQMYVPTVLKNKQLRIQLIKGKKKKLHRNTICQTL